ARDVVLHAEPQRLVRGQILRTWCRSWATGCDHKECPQPDGKGTEQRDSRHTTSYETRLRGGRTLDFRLPRKSIALFPAARGESAPATDVRHLAVARYSMLSFELCLT